MVEPNTEGNTGDAVRRLDDFSDRLSPMLVKELRQGFRANAFPIGFIVLQAMLVLNLLVTIPSASARGGVTSPHFLLFMISAALLVFQPLRGISALSSEITNDTLDTLRLTRLSSWRITLGKWASLVSQSLLVVISIIPYLFMRYMLGGANLPMELLMVLHILLFSALLCALGVGLSVLPSFILRSITAFFAGWGVIALFAEFIWTPFFRDRPMWAATNPSLFHLVLILSLAYLTFACLQLGASSIAARAENHSSRLRVVSFLVILATLGFGAFMGNLEVSLVMSAMVLGAVSFVGFMEEPNEVPSVYIAFSRRGAPGYLAAPFLMPGWHSMVLYSLFCCLCMAGSILLLDSFGIYGSRSLLPIPNGFQSEEMLIAVAVPGTFYTVVAMAALFRKKTKPFRIGFLSVILICGSLTLMLTYLIDELRFPGSLILVLFFLPTSYLILAEYGGLWSNGPVMASLNLMSVIIVSLAITYLIIKSLRIHRRIVRNAADYSGKAPPGGGSAGPPSGSSSSGEASIRLSTSWRKP